RTLLEGTEGRPYIEKNVRNLQRFLLGNATEIQLDTKGRFIVPDYLRQYAGIEKNIVFVGVGRFAEIWDKKMWYDHETEMTTDGTIAKIAEKLTGEGDE
ncbi:MAG TPA: division/cell wall cluster transcriptional repressor MraZ, partial [Candidatus Levybacteria bacterium]|nr:division/cell wall cluster transcriptional repressor MraZ [Candidatus Levybacteria bacterium]